MSKHAIQTLIGAIRARRTHGNAPSGIPLPPLRFRMGGDHFRSDSRFVSSAIGEVARLEKFTSLSRDSRLLDWGCGAGRLAIGLAERFGRIDRYQGVDVQPSLIAWAQRHIGSREGFHFVHADAANERYNPNGASAPHIPATSNGFDVFYAYSVFSHLNLADSAGYMKEVHRLLAPNGAAFITAFVEDAVPSVTENPEDYGPMAWSGRLHCVRFERATFERLIQDAGLLVDAFEYGGETDGQSLYILRKNGHCDRPRLRV